MQPNFSDDPTMPEYENYQEVAASDLDLARYLEGLPPAVQASARSADVLLLPTELGEDHPGQFFPDSTYSVFEYLRTHMPDGLTVEAAVDEDNYGEYSYKSIDVILPIIFAAESLASAIAVKLLADWIKGSMNRKRQPEDHRIIVEIHTTSLDGSPRSMKYKGPADDFEKTMEKMLKVIQGHGSSDEPQ